MTPQSISPDSFQTFGDILKYLRRREHLTQLELSIAVGYSDAQITRLEKNQRRPDISALKALFVPALHMENEPVWIARFLELAESARQEEAPALGIAPYKGLLHFDESDAELFFGRENLSTRLVDRVTGLTTDTGSRLLTVVGASGSGKSSLVRAGLAVALKQKGWDVRILTPGAHPLKALEMQLEPGHDQARNGPLVLLVDQFEETFTLCHNDADRALFIESLLSLPQESSKASFVVIVLRADFYSHCAHYPLLRQAVAAEQEYIGQMSKEELKSAIEEPARQGGWEFEPGLVDLLLNDIGAQGTGEPEPGALPLLSHALLATWERRRGRTLTLDGYHASGGVRGAIAETAESVFTDQLNQTQQELARDVFLRLTELGEGTEDTRRRAALNELVRQSIEAAQLRAVLNTLAEARLITLNEDSAEVAHEALIREWERLRGWLTQDREGLLLHRHLTEAAYEWQRRGHDVSELYRGARLAQAREWALTHEEKLNAAEQAFLTASMEQVEHDALERERQRQRELEAAQRLAETERRSARRLRLRNRLITAIGAVALVLAGLAVTFAWSSDRNAQQAVRAQLTAQADASSRATAEALALLERNTAEQQSLIASVRELSSQANLNLDVDPERSVLLALQAVEQTYSASQTVLPEAEDALRRAIQAARVERTLAGHTDIVWWTVFSPDGSRIATASADGTAKVWDADTGEELFTLRGHTGGIYCIAFSPDGTLLVTGSVDTTARLWDARTGQELQTFTGHSGEVFSAVFSPDGALLATGDTDGVARIWDVKTGQRLLMMHEESEGAIINQLNFSPDGKRLVVACEDGEMGWASIWDASTGEKLIRLSGHTIQVRSAAFSPDGKHLATASADRTIKIWDASNGTELRTIYGHTDVLSIVAFSPDSQRIVSAGWDRQVKIWDAGTGEQLMTLLGHSDQLWSASFSPDGTRLVTSGSDRTARVWNLSPSRELLTVVNEPALPSPAPAWVAYSPDGTRLVTSNVNPTPQIWDIATGQLLFNLEGHTAIVRGLAFSPDGSRIASASDDRTVKIWDAETGRELSSLPARHTDIVVSVAFHPDGTRLATGSFDNTAKVWDAATGKDLLTLRGHTQMVVHVTFSPDGRRLATAGFDGTASVWDAGTGKLLLLLSGHENAIRQVSFNSDGTQLVTASFDGTAKIWDAGTGKELMTLSGHSGLVFSAAFSPDDRFIATGSTDSTTKLWDVSTGREVLTLYSDAGGVTNLAFSPDGTRLATANRDGTTRMYLLQIEDLMALAQQRVTRSLTLQECQQYLHTALCPDDP
ncbi:MAG TPA: hypothetical protein VFY26_09195 [Anaerolineales bacterium]|nr:hypothetical protein [Anaerolineales bacterium]